MTHDELLAKIDEEVKNNEFACIVMAGAPDWILNSLRAVVELHKPCEPVSDDQFVTCETCNYEYHREYPWPCKTIQAIEKELG
jgi:hypothetical protein